ncbi:MAG: glycosyltransferase [Lachnospiraceae bacterium]|nr:glycosyltransferase [Lachnospiraceae bacterium]
MSIKVQEKEKIVLFIGTYADDEYLQELIENKIYNQTAANITEKYYIQGLKAYCQNVSVLSALVIARYPKCLIKKVKRRDKYEDKILIKNVGFSNLPLIRFFSQTASLQNEAKKWALENRNKKDNADIIVIVYAMRFSFLKAAKVVKKIIPSIKIINIVPDLPIYMHMNNHSLVQKIKSQLNQRLLIGEQKNVDYFALYTKEMRNILKCTSKNSIVIEGIVDAKDINNNITNVEKTDKEIILYAGSIDEKYGIKTLIEGFINANLKKCELHICGSGSYSDDIIRISSENNRIKYWGLVSPQEARKKMFEASLLVNPRPSNEEFTKYSCPSKTLEYMSTGVPVLMTRLKGVPDEYYDYVYTIDNESSIGIKEALERVFTRSKEERIQRGQEAKKYILDNKNYYSQVRKLLKFIEKEQDIKSL